MSYENPGEDVFRPFGVMGRRHMAGMQAPYLVNGTVRVAPQKHDRQPGDAVTSAGFAVDTARIEHILSYDEAAHRLANIIGESILPAAPSAPTAHMVGGTALMEGQPTSFTG